jgi:ABC-type uncharacterized transport system substrate-binding protein
MCERELYVYAGCLMSYSVDEEWSYRRAATYVDRILKGAKPADLPVEQASKFKMVINLKTANQIGSTIPRVCWHASKPRTMCFVSLNLSYGHLLDVFHFPGR